MYSGSSSRRFTSQLHNIYDCFLNNTFEKKIKENKRTILIIYQQYLVTLNKNRSLNNGIHENLFVSMFQFDK